MVRYLSGGVLVLLCVLAVLSRKNFSKYKISYFLVHFLPERLRDSVQKDLRREKTLNLKLLQAETDRFLARRLHVALLILAVVSVFTFLGSFLPEKPEKSGTVTRPEKGTGTENIPLILTDPEKKDQEEYVLKLKERELSSGEFEKLAAAAISYTDSIIAGTNPDLQNVTADLVLPEKDESGMLSIRWQTSRSEVISRKGKLMPERPEQDAEVLMTGIFRDGKHEKKKVYSVTVQYRPEELSDMEQARKTLVSMEEASRTETGFTLPEKIGKISLKQKVRSRSADVAAFFLAGVMAAALGFYYGISRLREKTKNRDAELEAGFYRFENRLNVLLGAGITVREAMMRTAARTDAGYLKNELDYCCNMIRAGVPEVRAYTEFGKNTGRQEYMRLMSLISQNLSHGNSNLLNLMDQEMTGSFYARRELMRKKGEQASEKMMLPTFLLMIVVIGIVIFPAMVGMK